MKHLRKSLEAVYHHAIQREYDRIIPVVGDEGVGKSTLMLRMVLEWQDITGQFGDANPLDQLVWGDRSAFKKQIIEGRKQSTIAVMDAARVLYKRDAMVGEQKDLQKSLLDSRFKENVILLGYQSWGDIPTTIQERRAKNAAFIPRRGQVEWYNRDQMDERCDEGRWPKPIFREGFRSLEGTAVWDEFKRLDRQKKEQRILGEEDYDPKEIRKREQTKFALRLVEPWNDLGGMPQTEAEQYIEYGQSWISKRVKEWERGHLQLDESIPQPASADPEVAD
jgi:hypothetical protein